MKSLGGNPTSTMPPIRSMGAFQRRFLQNRAGVITLIVLAVMVIACVLAPLLAPNNPSAQNFSAILAPPLTPGYILGADDLGRDVLSRLLYAGRISMMAVVQSVLVAFVIGVPLGLISGYVGGRLDAVVMRIADGLMSFPPLIFALTIIAALGPSLSNAMIAIGLILSPRFLRLVRGSVLTVREETYIEAARTIGTPAHWIILRHIIPNILSPLIVQISLAAAYSLLSEASLSFLGLGVQPPQSSWGSMMRQAFRFIDVQPWLIVWPGLMVVLCVLCLNVLGDVLRDSFGREMRRG